MRSSPRSLPNGRASMRRARCRPSADPRRPMITDAAAPRALTLLSDDEALFQGAVAGFAEGHVRPLVQQMERDAKLDPALIKEFFGPGLMGIEVPEEYGGAGGSLAMVAIAVEEISKVDAAA